MTVTDGAARIVNIASRIMMQRGFTDEQAAEIKRIGANVYRENGANGMHQVYEKVNQKVPAMGSTLSKIWDGIGGWAD